jgi:hypothetical protein
LLLAGGLTAADAQPATGSGIGGTKIVRHDLNFTIVAPSDEWAWVAMEPEPGSWLFKATHAPTGAQAVLGVMPLRGPLSSTLANEILAGMVDSIMGRQPGFEETGRTVKPSDLPRSGSFDVETSIRNDAQGFALRVFGRIFSGERLFSLLVLSGDDFGREALESLVGSFQFLREPPIASLGSAGFLARAEAQPRRSSSTTGRNPAGSLGVVYLLVVLLFAGLGWLVNKVAGRPVWDAGGTVLVLLLILLVIQIVGAAGAAGPDAGKAVGRAIGTALIPLLIAAWLSKRFRGQRARATREPQGSADA